MDQQVDTLELQQGLDNGKIEFAQIVGVEERKMKTVLVDAGYRLLRGCKG
jgi:hypothetical protein